MSPQMTGLPQSALDSAGSAMPAADLLSQRAASLGGRVDTFGYREDQWLKGRSSAVRAKAGLLGHAGKADIQNRLRAPGNRHSFTFFVVAAPPQA